MKIKLYVLNRNLSTHTFFLISSKLGITSYFIGKNTSKALRDDSRFKKIIPFGFHLFLNELEQCPTYHRAVAINAKSSKCLFVIQIVDSSWEYLDRTW